MNAEQAKGIRSGYRTVGILLFVGFAAIGFTRLEDRAIIGAPGATPANAMAALPLPLTENDSEETYSEAPDEFVSIGNASRVPSNRIRRVLRERDVPVVASRQILAPGGANAAVVSGPPNDPGTSAAIGQVLTPITATPASLASLALPPLGNSGVPIFAANVPPGGGGSGDGGGGAGGGGGGSGVNNPGTGDGGSPGGGDGEINPGNGDGGNPGDGGGGTNPGNGDGGNPGDGGGGTNPGNGDGGNPGGGGDPPVVPVSPVPEPGTWAMLIMGLFGVGAALRRKSNRSAVASLHMC